MFTVCKPYETGNAYSPCLVVGQLLFEANRYHFHRDADVAVLDAGDIYTAGLQYDEIPIIAEVYNLGTPEYYVVAVAKEEDPSTEMTYLKGTICARKFVTGQYA